MLRIIQNSTAAGAKSYYCTADYYSEGQELAGTWRGKGAEKLGLAGAVEKADWDALCDNRDPGSGCALTARQKDGRRVGYDLNFHAPKSLSVLYALTEDERLLDAFRSAVEETMQDIEREVQTRVRKKGANSLRDSGNAVWGEFVHTTARPVDGVPDPHLHSHCFLFNATFDSEEGSWKAVDLSRIKRDAPYFEAVFHSRLTRKIGELGLGSRRTKPGWELAGLPASVAQKFSRRTAQIEERAREAGITDPHAKGELGAKTRRGKTEELSMRQLRALWQSWLTADEADAMRREASRIGGEPVGLREGHAAGSVSHALAHELERSSVVPERTVLATAIRHAYGVATHEQVAAELGARPLLRARRRGRDAVTTQEVLAEEEAMVAFARDGRGTCAPLAPGEHRFVREWLSDDQKVATCKILGSRDRVTVLRGRAGTGKTSMMSEAVEAIEAAGSKVFTFAPSAAASRGVLRAEGFESAETVARLLLDETMQEQARGQVIWVDEAGLLGARTMSRLFETAARLDARLVLSGDRAQHGSVERGSALRLLEEEAGIVPAQLREIHRQKGEYRRAVRLLSEDDVAGGFQALDRLGWVREVDEAQRYRMLASDYVDAVSAGSSALCVSPTHAEGRLVTDAVRAQLKQAGRLGSVEHIVPTLARVNLTDAERGDQANYELGDVIVFHQNGQGVTKGTRLVVGEDAVPLEQAAKFQVYRPGRLAVAEGDMLRITAGGKTLGGKHRLENGAIYRVRRFDGEGNIELSNGWRVARDFGHLAHGYCVTSHAAQGRTVDRVFVGQSSDSLPASSREQFYVSASRGRKQVVVYTDDKEALMDAVERFGERLSATELLRARQLHRDAGHRPVPVPARGDEMERAHG